MNNRLIEPLYGLHLVKKCKFRQTISKLYLVSDRVQKILHFNENVTQKQLQLRIAILSHQFVT